MQESNQRYYLSSIELVDTSGKATICSTGCPAFGLDWLIEVNQKHFLFFISQLVLEVHSRLVLASTLSRLGTRMFCNPFFNLSKH